MGPADCHDYTVEADVRATEKRRQMGDGGVIAQRYGARAVRQQPEARAAALAGRPGAHGEVPFAWKPDTWYRVKLRVENDADGDHRGAGQGVAARRARAGRMDDREASTDRHRAGRARPLRRRAPEIFFDNVKVSANQ